MTEGPYKLPEGWRWVRLGEVFCLRNGKFIRGGDLSTGGSVPVYGANGLLGFTATPLLTQGKTIVIGRVGACGAVNVVEAPCWISDNAMFVSRWHTDCDVEYVALALRSVDLSRLAKKGAQPSISQEAVYSALIPLPPLAEQRRIVARIEELMDRVREARRLRQEAQKDAERLWQSVLAQTFPRPGSELPEGWRWVRLGEVCETKMGGTPSTKVREYWEPPEIVWVTPEDMRRQELNRITSSRRQISVVGLEKSSAKLFPAGAVLLSTTATIGKVGIAEIPLSANQQISGIICSENINHEFIAYYLLSVGEDGLRKFGGTATATHINQTNLKSLPIPLPPLAEQRRIVAHLEAVQERLKALKEAQAATEAELKRLEQAILEKAFRGEL
jgi:type I restriction enzyme S subunit